MSNKEKIFEKPAPKNLSLINNPEETIRYFGKYHKASHEGFNLNFNHRDINQVTIDAIGLLLANIYSPDYLHGNQVSGVLPDDPELKKIFGSTSFYKHVIRKGNNDQVDIKGDMWQHWGQNKINSEIAEKAVDCIIGMGTKYQHLYPIFMECMSNTSDHAAGSRNQKVYNWWITYHIDEGTNTAKICFIDLGVGIFGSLDNKWDRGIFALIGASNNAVKLEKMLRGLVQLPSRTKQKERGLGLPQIYRFSQRAEVDKFIIITNNVFGSLKEDSYKNLKEKFNGTFLYWEMNLNIIQTYKS